MATGKGPSSRLRERISIEVENLVDNQRGGRRRVPGEDGWREIASCVAAEIIPLRGDEALNLSVQRSTQLYRVTIRDRVDITTKHRLIWQGMALNIRTAPPSTDRTYRVMTCEAGVAN